MQKTVYTLLFLVNSFSAFAQTTAPAIQWQKTYGGTNGDGAQCIEQTQDHGYIIGANSLSNISGNKTVKGYSTGFNADYWVIKTDSLGNNQWQKNYGGANLDQILAIHQTSDGGFVIGGSSESNTSADKSENCIGSFDYWVIKTDALGNIIWEQTIGGNNADEFYDLKETPDKGFILAGNSWSPISGDKTENPIAPNYMDYWVVKLDSTGTIQWQNTIGGDKDERLYTIALTTDGGYLLGGRSFSDVSGDKTLGHFGRGDIWLVKLNSTGTIIWQKNFGGANEDELQDMKSTKDGGFILGGSSVSGISGTKTVANKGYVDYWIIRIDSVGNIKWQKDIGGDDFDYVCSIDVTSDNGFIILGDSRSDKSGDKTEDNKRPGAAADDFWIVKLDAIGSVQWEKTIGSYENDFPEDIHQTADGGYIIAGSSKSNASFDKTDNSWGSEDAWIIKLGPDRIPCTTCPKPTYLNAQVVTKTKVKLNWDTTACAIKYKIHYRKQGTTAWNHIIVGTNIGWKTLTGLTANTTYEWYMNTVCSITPLVIGPDSKHKTFTTPLRLEEGEEITNADITLYPNPATNQLTGSSEQLTGEYEIRIYNLMGQQVKTVRVNVGDDEKISLNISELPTGYYQLTLTNGATFINKPFVKE